MKKIINGRKYDTETAEHLSAISRGDGFTSVDESLYRKRNGEYFLYASGGPMTKYGVHEGNNIYGGSSIIPMDELAARKWAEKNLDGDEYEAIFGEVEE